MAKPVTDAPKRPRIEVLERRLQNPFGEPSAPVDLRDPTRECRWFNADKSADHIWRNKQKGWENVKPADVVDLEQIGGYTIDASGFIVRGERGREVLMSMPKDWRRQIEFAKAKHNTRNFGNPSATKQEVVDAASAQLGDQAADFLNRAGRVSGQVRDSIERVQRVEDGE